MALCNLRLLQRWRQLPTLQRNFLLGLILLICLVLLWIQYGFEPRPLHFVVGMPRPKGYEQQPDEPDQGMPNEQIAVPPDNQQESDHNAKDQTKLKHRYDKPSLAHL